MWKYSAVHLHVRKCKSCQLSALHKFSCMLSMPRRWEPTVPSPWIPFMWIFVTNLTFGGCRTSTDCQN